jgi:hypothetical protein
MKAAGGLICMIAAFAVWGAALAQDAAVQGAGFSPEFEARPVDPDHPTPPRFYPPRALEHLQSGAVVLCCRALENRTLSCRVAWEEPRGRKFGEAAENIVVPHRQLTEASYAEYAARAPGSEFAIPMSFRLGRDAPEAPTKAERDAMCAAPA